MARTGERADPVAATPGGATPALIRWGAVIGGGIIGLSLLVLLAALWLALAFGTGVAAVEANLDWFMTISAIVAMFVGGLLAGWLSGVPGFAPGMFNGLTVWGVILTVSLIAGTPGALQTMGVPTEATIGAIGEGALWAGFVALLIGAVAAALGGGLGGATTRPAFVYAASTAVERDAPEHRDRAAPAHSDRTHSDRKARDEAVADRTETDRDRAAREETSTDGDSVSARR